MLRNTGAILAGLITTFALIYGIEMLGHSIYPPPAGLDFSDSDAMRPYIASLPIQALLFPMFAWFIGTFCGVLLARQLGTARPIVFATVIGMLVLAGTIANLIMIPHPLWYAVIAVFGIIGSAWLATGVGAAKKWGHS
ncbi:MAG: hypothetical protein OEO82_00955 [Gammaproteobacteria bacterium]|nr:hypothetical protein [Gammaproteobacteria bacterium]